MKLAGQEHVAAWGEVVDVKGKQKLPSNVNLLGQALPACDVVLTLPVVVPWEALSK
jgi:hypothetical protein